MLHSMARNATKTVAENRARQAYSPIINSPEIFTGSGHNGRSLCSAHGLAAIQKSSGLNWNVKTATGSR